MHGTAQRSLDRLSAAWAASLLVCAFTLLPLAHAVGHDAVEAAARQHVHADGTSHAARDGLHFGTLALDPAPIVDVAPAQPLPPEPPAELPLAPVARRSWSPLQPQGP